MILDTNHDVTSALGQLKALGYTQIIRYIATGSKSLTPSESRAIASAGFQLATVYEGYGDTRGELNAQAGISHAQSYLNLAPRVGQPDGSGMYYAVDADEDAANIRANIIPYFTSIKSVIGARFRVGVYGSGATCAAILDAGLAELSWLSCSTGWTGYQSFKASGRWNLLQHTPKVIAGLDTDPDDINPLEPDFGAFIPFGSVAVSGPVVAVHDAKWMQGILQTAGFYQGKLDGDVGPLTITAMIAYLEKSQGVA